jgi:hypothetical protein
MENKFPWLWRGATFRDKAMLRRALRVQFNIGRTKGVHDCVNDARKQAVISADEYAEFVKEYGL